ARAEKTAILSAAKALEPFRPVWNCPCGFRGGKNFLSGRQLLHEAFQYPLLPGLVEIDGQLVAFDRGHIAIAELQVKDAVPGAELRRSVRDRTGHELALDGPALHRAAPGAEGRIRFAIADALDGVARSRAPVARRRLG